MADSLDAAETSAGEPRGHGFGTTPVFLASISTILGAILFLRFGYAVGHVGMLGAIGIVLLGHLVTVPTALALAEIATNRRVEGGGEYFIISRSFGRTVGTVIGMSLYASQAISAAFYMIAFAEAFRPLAGWLWATRPDTFEPRLVSVPMTALLFGLLALRGAKFGVAALYAVAGVLALSLGLFFLGDPLVDFTPERLRLSAKVPDPDPFLLVFAIVFPGFTGMTAGVGLSGDLANPRRSIPTGTMLATGVGLLVYLAVVFKLARSAPPEVLASDPLVMADIALWGPIIPIGLGAATLSSALGSMLVAPRTLQALGADQGLPSLTVNKWLGSGAGSVNEPRNAIVVTGLIALAIAALGSVDIVARLISMFFMVTYGSLSAISFLEHFAARPSYRPSFRTRWYISLFGALICLLMMFQMSPLFAVLALGVMTLMYRVVRRRTDVSRDDLAAMFQGVMTRLTRLLHVQLQRRRERLPESEWRPSIIMVNGRTFDRSAPLELLNWLSYRQGFGTYLHHIPGNFDAEAHRESERVRRQLVTMVRELGGHVYVDTLVSPSMTSALVQSLQVPGVAGVGNNIALFELSVHDPPSVAEEVAEACGFAAIAEKSLLVLRHGDFHFGRRRHVHIWLTWNDRTNAALMVLLCYVLLGHPDWSEAEIRVFAALPQGTVDEERQQFLELVQVGRLPISRRNIRFFAINDLSTFNALVERLSKNADLTVLGFDGDSLKERGSKLFHAHAGLNDVLFVYAVRPIGID